jgi:hypothetical protein
MNSANETDIETVLCAREFQICIFVPPFCKQAFALYTHGLLYLNTTNMVALHKICPVNAFLEIAG